MSIHLYDSSLQGQPFFLQESFVLTADQMCSDGKYHECILTNLSVSLNERVNETDPKLYSREIH